MSINKTVADALKLAYNLGQRYWQQADSDYESQHVKSDLTAATFKQLFADTETTLRAALAQPDVQPTLPTLEQIEQMAQAMVARKELNWAGFRQDAQGKYTIPVISESQYKLVLGAIKNFSQPVQPKEGI